MPNFIHHYNSFSCASIFQAAIEAARKNRGFERAFRRVCEYFLFPDNRIRFIVVTNNQGGQNSIFKYDIIERLYTELGSVEEVEYTLVAWLFKVSDWLKNEYPEIHKDTFTTFLVKSHINGKDLAVPHIYVDLCQLEKRSKKWKIELVEFLDELLFAFRNDNFKNFAVSEKDEKIINFIKQQKESNSYS